MKGLRHVGFVLALAAVLLFQGVGWACQDASCGHGPRPDFSPSGLAPAFQLLASLEHATSREAAAELIGTLRQRCDSYLREALHLSPKLADDLRQELDRLSFSCMNEEDFRTDPRVRLGLDNLRTLLSVLEQSFQRAAAGSLPAGIASSSAMGSASHPSARARQTRDTGRVWISMIHPNQWYFVAKTCGLCQGTGQFPINSQCGICYGSRVIHSDPSSKPCGFCGGRGWRQGSLCGGCYGMGWCQVDLPDPNRLYEFRTCSWCGGTGWTQNGSCHVCNGDGWNQIPKVAPPCNGCGGSGRGQYGSPCDGCRGTGWARVAVTQPAPQFPGGSAQPGAANPAYPNYPPPPNIHELMSLQICGLCQGGGKYRGAYFCPACGADGYVTVPNPPRHCNACGGSGRTNNGLCSNCGATGWQDGALYSVPPGRSICKRCRGEGSISNGVFCTVCNGQGWVFAAPDPIKKSCGMCKGNGTVGGRFCPACNGNGWARLVMPAPDAPGGSVSWMGSDGPSALSR